MCSGLRGGTLVGVKNPLGLAAMDLGNARAVVIAGEVPENAVRAVHRELPEGAVLVFTAEHGALAQTLASENRHRIGLESLPGVEGLSSLARKAPLSTDRVLVGGSCAQHHTLSTLAKPGGLIVRFQGAAIRVEAVPAGGA